jgi:uncharacterized protein
MSNQTAKNAPVAIAREDDGISGRYVARLGNGEEAEMTYRRAAPGTLVFDHTLVPPAFRGYGVAAKLMDRAIADAREEGFKIVPVCSYVVAQFRRHPEWSDLLAE